MKRRTLAGAFGCLGILLLIGAAVVVWAILAAPADTPVIGNLRYECTLAASQTKVTVTVKGPFSGRECQRLANQTDLLPVHLELSDATPTEPLICTFTSQRTTVTVNGPSLLKLAQGEFCQLVKQIATFSSSAGIPPSVKQLGVVGVRAVPRGT